MNFVKFTLFSLISILIYLYAQKFLAVKYGCSAILDIWKIQRFGLWTSAKFPRKINLLITKLVVRNIPVGIFLPLIISLLSDGQIFFAAAFATAIVVHPGLRLGKKYRRLTEYESAKIAVMGPLISILIAAIFSFAGIFKEFVFVNSMLAVFNMLPLPGLAGSTVFFGSRPLYVFGYTFILALAILLNLITFYMALILAAVAAVVALVSYMYFYETK